MGDLINKRLAREVGGRDCLRRGAGLHESPVCIYNYKARNTVLCMVFKNHKQNEFPVN